MGSKLNNQSSWKLGIKTITPNLYMYQLKTVTHKVLPKKLGVKIGVLLLYS